MHGCVGWSLTLLVNIFGDIVHDNFYFHGSSQILSFFVRTHGPMCNLYCSILGIPDQLLKKSTSPQNCVLESPAASNSIDIMQSWQQRAGHDYFGITFLCIGKPQWTLYNIQWKSDWLFNTQSRVLQADWLISANIEMASVIIGSCNVATKSDNRSIQLQCS